MAVGGTGSAAVRPGARRRSGADAVGEKRSMGLPSDLKPLEAPEGPGAAPLWGRPRHHRQDRHSAVHLLDPQAVMLGGG